MLATPRDWELVDARLARLLLDPRSLELTSPPPRDKTADDGACAPHRLRPEWRANATAAKECAYLVTKRWAREDGLGALVGSYQPDNSLLLLLQSAAEA